MATAIFGLARNVWVLALSRFLQGLSAATVWTVGFALLVDTVGQEEVGQSIGYVLTSVNVGILTAPLFGGLLYDKLGYLSLFVVMLGLILFDIALRLIMIEKKKAWKWAEPRNTRNYGGTEDHGTQEAGYDLNRREINREGVPPASPVSPEEQALLSHHEKHPPPLITLLKSPRILAALYGKWVEATIVIGFDSALPLFVSRTFGWDSLGAGLIFLTRQSPPSQPP